MFDPEIVEPKIIEVDPLRTCEYARMLQIYVSTLYEQFPPKRDLMRINQLKVQLKEVERFEADKKKFEDRIAIVQKLQKNQSVPVHLLDDVSRALPDRVWLSALKEKDGAVTIEGYAFSNADIVMFGNNLKSSKYLGDVAVVESTETNLENQPVFKFTVACKVTV